MAHLEAQLSEWRLAPHNWLLAVDTRGLINCQASFIALYALKPSTGLISRYGLLPSSTVFGDPGMFGKSVWDLASLPTTVARYDMKHPVTLEALAYESHDYTISLASEWSD